MYIGVPLILSKFILHIKTGGWDFAKLLKITKVFVEETYTFKILKRHISNNKRFCDMPREVGLMP